METSEITRLRKLLLNLDDAELLKLKKLLNYPSDLAIELAKVLPEAVLFAAHENERLSTALVPTIENIITRSVAQNPNLLANALYPIIGRSIRKSINEEFKKLLLTFSELIENTFSLQALKWRYQALVTGRKYSEVVISNTIKYKAEHLFLIHRKTGLLLCDVHDEISRTADPDTISGMLKAITDFVHDSFENVGDSNLNLIELEDYQVIIEQGPYAILASLVRGYIIDNYRNLLEETLEKVHQEYNSSLSSFSGDTFMFEPSRELLKKCLVTEKKEAYQKKKNMNIGIAVVIPIIIILLLWGGRAIYFKMEWQKYIRSLETSENILLSQYGKNDGAYYVQGLIMPGTQHPDSLQMAYHFPKKGFSSKWRLYFPGETILVHSFLESNLGKPKGLTMKVGHQKIVLSGWCEKLWFDEFTRLMHDSLPWFTVEDSKLRIVDQNELVEQVDRFNQIHLYFENGNYKLVPTSEAEFEKQINVLARLITQLENIGRGYKLVINGYADRLGDPTFNMLISQKRAESVAKRLIDAGIAGEHIKVVGCGIMTDSTGLKGAQMRRVDFNLTID